MYIKINDLKWQVDFLDGDDDRLVLDDVKCLGITVFSDYQIYIKDNMSKEALKQTVLHELAHAFLFSYGIHLPIDKNETEEAVCDFIGVYSPKINKAANKILEFYGNCNKGVK